MFSPGVTAYISVPMHFHTPSVADDRFLRAVSAIATAGAWIVVQVLDHEETVERTERLLRDAFVKLWQTTLR